MNLLLENKTDQKRVPIWFRQIVSASLLLAVGLIYSRHIDFNGLTRLLAQAAFPFLVLGYLVGIMVFLIRTGRWNRLLREFSIIINFSSLFLMYLVDQLLNNFVSGLSMAIRGMYISKEIKSQALMVRLLLLDKLFDWVIPVTTGLVSLLSVLKQWHPYAVWSAWGVSLTLLPFIIWQSLIWLQRLALLPTWPRQLQGIRARVLPFVSVNLSRSFFQTLLRMFVFSITGFSAYYLTLFLLAKCFSLPILPTELIMADSMATIAVVVPLNFAGIGTRDVAMAGLLAYYGCPHENIALFIASLILFRLGVSLLGWFSLYILKWKGYSITIKKQP